MDSLLLGTCHPLLVDEPPDVCPTNMQGEAQKFLNQLWIAQLIKKFDPAAVFDESRVALTSLAVVHEKVDFFSTYLCAPGALDLHGCSHPLSRRREVQGRAYFR